jgi:DNA polymerase-3 subunit epsilon
LLPVVLATAEELAAHEAQLADLDKVSGGACVWAAMQQRTGLEIAAPG